MNITYRPHQPGCEGKRQATVQTGTPCHPGTAPTLAVVVNAVVDALADMADIYGVTHIEMPVM